MDNEDPSLPFIDKILARIDVDENSRQLYKLHYRKVINFFRRKGFLPEECQDLTQQVFLRVFKGIATFRRESRFEGWLLQIEMNVFRNTIRGKKAEKRDATELSIDGSQDEDQARVEPASEEKDALISLVERERRLALLSALRDLPAQMRLCCELRYVRGLKYQEIAEEMKISIETVKAHLHQARKRLIEKLGGK